MAATALTQKTAMPVRSPAQAAVQPEPKGRFGPRTVSVAAVARPPASSFDDLYDRLPKPSNWSWSWSALMSGASRNLPTLPRNRAEFWRVLGSTGKIRSWGAAHIWYGAMSSGKGRHFHDIALALAERDACLRKLCELPDRTELARVDNQAFREATATIHDDLLETLARLAAALHYTSLQDLSVIEVLTKLLDLHKAVFAAGNNAFVDASDRPANVCARVADMLEGCLARAKANGVLARRHDALAADRAGLSALVAQLILDAGTIAKMAGICQAAGGNAVDGELTAALEAREMGPIQTLRRTGLLSLGHADHVIRAFDYVTHGLSNPHHKLNLALCANGIVGREAIAERYADRLADMAVGDAFKIEGGWSRGVRPEWLLIGYTPELPGGYFGMRPQFGLDQAYTYYLKVERQQDGVKISFGRTGVLAARVGVNAYAYGPGVAGSKFWSSYGTVNAKLSTARGSEDLLSITLDSEDSTALKASLTSLLSGQVEDPYAFFRQAGAIDSSHTVKHSTNLSLAAGIDGVTRFDHLFSKNLSGHAKLSPLNCSVELSLFAKSSERGYGYKTADGAHSRSRKSQTITPLTHRPELEVNLGLLSISPRLRQNIDLSASDTFSDGRSTGAAASGAIGGIISYKADAKPWGTVFGRPPSPEIGSHHVRRDDADNVDQLKWDMTLPRAAESLVAPDLLALLERLEPGNAALACSELVNVISYTTRANRLAIADLLKQLEVARPDLAADVMDLKSRADFTRRDDRWKFRRRIRRIAAATDRKGFNWLPFWSGRQAVDPKLQRIVSSLLALTDGGDEALWPARAFGEVITITMQATPEKLATLRSQAGSGTAIEAAAGESGFGRISSISISQERVIRTAFDWPVLIAFGSTASLTLSRKRILKIGDHADKAEEAAPAATAARALTAVATAGPVPTNPAQADNPAVNLHRTAACTGRRRSIAGFLGALYKMLLAMLNWLYRSVDAASRSYGAANRRER